MLNLEIKTLKEFLFSIMFQNDIFNGLKIISWNINGIKSLFSQNVINRQKELQNQLDYLDAPIICFQEAKLSGIFLFFF